MSLNLFSSSNNKTRPIPNNSKLIHIVVLFGTLFFILIFPLIAFVFSFIYIFRFIVSKISKYVRPDLQKILTTRSALFGSDELYTEPQSALILSAYLNGGVEVETIINGIKSTFLDTRNAVGGLQNQEALCYVTNWMGFLFWKEETNFRVEDHIEVYDDLDKYGLNIDKVTPECFNMVANKLGLRGKPFAKYKSPWEILLFRPTKKTSNAFIIIRVHHSLADGFSLLKRFLAMNGLSFEMELPKSPKIAFSQKLFYILAFPIIAPYHLVHQSIACRDLNAWHMAESKLTKKIISGNTSNLPTDYIRQIKRNLKCGFTSVILSALTGALRKYMIENQIKIPQRFTVVTVLPMPNHPDKLRNHMTACLVALPLQIAIARERLKNIDESIKKLKSSSFPIILFNLFSIIGGLFTCMSKRLRKNNFSSAILANIPGPENGIVDLLGHSVKEVGFSGGLHGCNIGISFTALSLNGKIRIACHVDKALISSQSLLNDLMIKIEEELHVLNTESLV